MFNTAAIKLAAEFEIPIFYFDRTGNLLAQLRGPTFLKQSRLRQQQMHFMHSENGKKWILRQIGLKTDLQMQTIARYSRKTPKASLRLEKCLQTLSIKKEILFQTVLNQTNFGNTIMGIEGGIAREYYKALNFILPEKYQFEKRSKRPGADYFNAAINYMYGMTYGEITKAIHAAGLDTFVGGLHTTPFKENLVFDCIEPFRPIIDRLLIEMCRDELLEEKHFKQHKTGFWLSKPGKRLIIQKYTTYLWQRIKLEDSLKPIQHHLYAQVKKLKMEIQNSTPHVPYSI